MMHTCTAAMYSSWRGMWSVLHLFWLCFLVFEYFPHIINLQVVPGSSANACYSPTSVILGLCMATSSPAKLTQTTSWLPCILLSLYKSQHVSELCRISAPPPPRSVQSSHVSKTFLIPSWWLCYPRNHFLLFILNAVFIGLFIGIWKAKNLAHRRHLVYMFWMDEWMNARVLNYTKLHLLIHICIYTYVVARSHIVH